MIWWWCGFLALCFHSKATLTQNDCNATEIIYVHSLFWSKHKDVIADISAPVQQCEWLDFLCMSCAGKQSDVLWGQCLHRQECDRVSNTPGQVRVK